MARGRMISRSIWSSKKFSALVRDHGPWAGLVYIACVTATDVEGRLEADEESLADLLSRTGRLAGKTPSELLEIVRAVASSGLLEVWGSGGDFFAEVVGFAAHNTVRRDREAPSRIPRENSGRAPGVLREGSGSTPPEVQVQVQEKEELQEPQSVANSSSPHANSGSEIEDSHKNDDRPDSRISKDELLKIQERALQRQRQLRKAQGAS